MGWGKFIGTAGLFGAYVLTSAFSCFAILVASLYTRIV